MENKIDNSCNDDDLGWTTVKRKVYKKPIRFTTTTNGATSFTSTGCARLDLFFKAVRSIEQEFLHDLLSCSWREDALDTMKLLFSFRNVRGGRGERTIFRQGLEWLLNQGEEKAVAANFTNITSMGRFDDWIQLLDCKSEQLQKYVAQTIAKQLQQDHQNMLKGKPISLCAKWCPSQQQSKTKLRSKIIEALGPDYTNKSYRQLITSLRSYLKIVETFLCTKQYENIDYSQVPSKCMHRLRNAFSKHDQERFSQYIKDVEEGKSKINASTLFPHELVRYYMRGGEFDPVIEEQWKQLVSKTKELGSLNKCIPLCDVSGSMSGAPMEVSVALGILISSIVPPPFHNLIIAFHETPTFYVLQGTTLKEKVESIMACPWGCSTNFYAVFGMLLQKAKAFKLSAQQMPEQLIVIGDMQFDAADRGYKGDTTYYIQQQYYQLGYRAPRMVYWNVRANTDDFVATSNTSGVAMIAGFSPSILKAVMEGTDFTPYGIMKQTINDPMYNNITLGEEFAYPEDIIAKCVAEQQIKIEEEQIRKEQIIEHDATVEQEEEPIESSPISLQRFYSFMYEVLESLNDDVE